MKTMDAEQTQRGKKQQKNRIERAIIMAAGTGTRMRPVTFDTPKPLIRVNGVRMIDTVIQALHENGIYEIYVVVGYKKEQFACLESEYEDVTLVENPYWDSCNNIASLYAAREHLENAMILDGDQIIYRKEILSPEFTRSGYNAVWTEEETDEWLMQVENGIVRSCSRTGGKGGWQLFSVSRWSREDGKKLKRHLELEFEEKQNRQIYWDDVAMFCHFEEYELGIYPMQEGDLIEIDDFPELCALDSSYCGYETRGRKKQKKNKLDRQAYQNRKIQEKGQIDWMITLLPPGMIAVLSILFFLLPEQSNTILAKVRFFLGDTFGVYYLAIGLGIFLLSLYLAFSKYGTIVLGEQDEKPKYSFFAWGSMMFTCGLAADILFYSFSEWVMYAADPQIEKMGGVQEWAGVYPLFHWSLIPWGFYLVLAAAFGFMLHVRKRNRQRYSEACRPILGKQTDGIGGRLIDVLAVFALLAGTATTFSVATPLMASAINALFHVSLDRTAVTIVILLITCFVYTYSLLHGFRGIGFLAKLCIYLFFGLLAYVLLFGGQTRYIIETGFSSLGRMIQYFPTLATDTDPLRETHFPQNWTIYYWAYWMVWCVAAPFFIGSISRGRTVRQTILGGYGFGVGSTILSFIILGNESMGMQMAGKADFIAQYAKDGDLYGMIIAMIQKIPCASLVLVVLLLTMIAFYATSFDSIALTVSCYSYRRLEEGQQPSKAIQLMWCLLLILLPIALVFSESSMSNLQSVSIVAAFPIGMVILLIVAGFLKDAGAYLKEIKKK